MTDKRSADGDLPQYTPFDQYAGTRRRGRSKRRLIRLAVAAVLAFTLYSQWNASNAGIHDAVSPSLSLERLETDHATCAKLRKTPQDPGGHRKSNARYVEGQKPLLIRNATVWTGDPNTDPISGDAHTGELYSWQTLDVLLHRGLIERVAPQIRDEELPRGTEVVNARRRQLTAGIVDMHSHTGVDALPGLRGNQDTNELSSDITPYVRSLDGLNPLDPQIQVIKSGGVTTSLILPGSGNNMGGEAFVIKHSVGRENGRPELSIRDLLADPERNWRYMKMACGENAKSVYGRLGRDFGPFSRLGEAWYFRHAFEEATRYKDMQDDWCTAADRIGPQHMTSYLPSELKWESLSALLRGQILLNTHCYTIPDLESFVGYTNEFKFPVRAFHHAHMSYLVPELLKRAYGGKPPAAALFADNMYYKAESYVASEQAGKILWENGITPVYVSDNPVLNAQHVVFEAAKAFKNGLPYHVALAGVTSASAELLGLRNRIGRIRPGFDADVVLWDSDPLSAGATPLQVFIDGTPQFDQPYNYSKPLTPPLGPSKYQDLEQHSVRHENITLTGVSRILIAGHEQKLSSGSDVVIRSGQIVCIGSCSQEALVTSSVMHLQDGHIAPALTAFGSLLGLEEIAAEDDTSDGANDQTSFSSAIDGLSFGSKNLKAAHSHGVTRAITAPKLAAVDRKGVSVAFRTGANNALEKNAVIVPNVALHYSLGLSAKGSKTPSISSAVAELRSKLMKAIASNITQGAEEEFLQSAVAGEIPLVINVHSADVIASLLRLKKEVEAAIHKKSKDDTIKLRLAILGGAESHLLANELAQANVGVVLAPLFSYGVSWDQRRALTGAPLTNGTAIDILHAAGVQVAIGVDEDWEARDLFLQAGIVQVNSGGKINETEALGLVSSNIYDILGINEGKDGGLGEFSVFEGNPLTTNSQLRVVADGRGSVAAWHAAEKY
ncbi:hypothetical protein DOTSEDRAFT_164108 [Dothistroma septosporum NZE10]|uniref:Amidohydrolase-related domain-containing protein n=1 Tax=Dothistroma septosporum (strain NZE10 / CBS 128990) TaxID=675120 RepID=N1Q1M1_DOTSN|nr:hypothetical protein DOTSEDRAFT_164108 [Dothistroma septosporum NZE10]